MTYNIKDTFCSYCGTKYKKETWPRICSKCDNTTWRNPIPVSVALVPIADGLLGVRRGIEPKKGQLALPGGYHNFGETWQEALVRELEEETGAIVHAQSVELFNVATDALGKYQITFGIVPPTKFRFQRKTTDNGMLIPLVTPNDEVEEVVILTQQDVLAFPLHNEAAQHYFSLQDPMFFSSRS